MYAKKTITGYFFAFLIVVGNIVTLCACSASKAQVIRDNHANDVCDKLPYRYKKRRPAHASTLFGSDQYVCGQTQQTKSNCCIVENDNRAWRYKKRRFMGHSVITDFFSEMIRDVCDLHYQLFSWESFCIIAATTPPFIAARMIDDRFHGCFYDKHAHKNRHQLSSWCQQLARYIIGVPAVLFSIDALFAKDDERRLTGQLLMIGFPFLIFGKDILKHVDFQCGKRPWNEYFSREKRSGGGFPSGHVAEATFVATLYGLRFGPNYAVPLALGAAFVAGTFVNCNRHYLSQVVAGAGLGILYAVAANKVVDSRLLELRNCRCSIVAGNKGRPAVSLSYTF